MKTEILAAIIAFFGIFITVVGSLLNTALAKKMERIDTKSKENNFSEIENNILAELIPVLEKKDVALDKIADILETQGRRIELVELGQKNQAHLLLERCQAPKLLSELKSLQDSMSEKEARQKVLNDLISNHEN